MREIKKLGEHRDRWMTRSSDEYESMRSTLEILSDPELLEQIKEGIEDYKAGRYKTLEDLIKGS